MLQIEHIVIVGAVVSLLGKLHYIRETIQGRTQPNRVSWLLWSIAPLIATAAAISDGVTWAAIPVFMAGFTPFLVFCSSFINPKAYWKLGTFDYLCAFFSILALVLWGITKEPVVAITCAILADCWAAVPTFVKSWRAPHTESGITYICGVFSSLTGLVAIKGWIFSEYGFLVFAIVQEILILFALYRHRLVQQHPN